MIGIKGLLNDVLIENGWELKEDKGKRMTFECEDREITISVKWKKLEITKKD